MSNLETINIISSVRSAIESYKGFTQGEKSYALTNLDSWLGDSCSFACLEENFAKLSLDVKPFLKDNGFIVA